MSTQQLIMMLAFAGVAWYLMRPQQQTWTPVHTQPPGPRPPTMANPLDAIAASTTIAGLIGASAVALLHKLRGGEEGIYVNPARDEFKQQFIPFAPPSVPRDSNGLGFYGLAWLMHELGRDDITRAFNAADTMQEFQAAVSDIAGLLTSQSARVHELATYAQMNGFGHA